MIQKEDRMFEFQHEMFADVVYTLGAMAAERVFYGENTSGVGGDVMSVTWRTARMVGGAAMGPQPFHVTPRDGQTEEQAREEVLRRFERIGLADHEPHRRWRPVRREPDRGRARRSLQAGTRGADPRPGLCDGAQPRDRQPRRDRAHRRGARDSAEIMGDELLELLDSVGLPMPEFDLARRVRLAAGRVLGGDRAR